MAAAAPTRAVATPRIEKKASHCPCLVSGSSAPNTISMASSGNVESTESTRPRFDSVVESVTQALKAASLAVEPKKVMTQSSTTTSTAPKPIRIGRMMRHSALYQYGPYRRSSRMLS